jgi:hypothetical protein
MGQAITVVEKGGTRPDVVVFELNRSLTGMGHERYRSLEGAAGNRPPDHVARILFGHGGVKAVHVYSNVVTVELAPGASTEGMAEALRNLFIHYREGVTPSLP